MAFTDRTFDSIPELVDYLNDIVFGAPLPMRVYGLDGLTLIIHDGVLNRTTTFVDTAGVGLQPKEILTQIRAAHANMANVALRSYHHSAPPKPRLAVQLAPYIVRDTGTANAILGFPVNPAGDVTVGANAVLIADIVSVHRTDEGNKISVIHE